MADLKFKVILEGPFLPADTKFWAKGINAVILFIRSSSRVNEQLGEGSDLQATIE